MAMDQFREATGDARRNVALFAFGDANQAIPGDDNSLCGFNDIAETDEFRQMLWRDGRTVGGDGDFDQGGEFLGSKKPGGVDGHLLLAINSGHSRPPRNAGGILASRVVDDDNIYFQNLLTVTWDGAVGRVRNK